MKFWLLASAILLGTSNVFSQESRELIKCRVTQHHVTSDQQKDFAEMAANEMTITITREQLSGFDAYNIPIGEYEGVKLALSMIAYPESHYHGGIYLSQYVENFRNLEPILAVDSDDVRDAGLSYRSPQNNLRVRVSCKGEIQQ